MNIFKPGDLVFAKVKGYAPWPARIEPSLENQNNKFSVFFYGTYQTAVINAKDIFPYHEYKEKLGNRINRKIFKEAMKEIETNPTVQGPSTSASGNEEAENIEGAEENFTKNPTQKNKKTKPSKKRKRAMKTKELPQKKQRKGLKKRKSHSESESDEPTVPKNKRAKRVSILSSTVVQMFPRVRIILNKLTDEDFVLYGVDINDPIVINEDTAQDPIVINEDTAQDPIVINEDTDDGTAQTLEGNSTTLEAVSESDEPTVPKNMRAKRVSILSSTVMRMFPRVRIILNKLNDEELALYGVDINDPIVINEDTAQDPIVINEDTAQDPIVINEDTAQDPIVINEDTAQDPIVINEDTAQDPIVINEDTAQNPIVINEDTAQNPIVINEDTAQDPIVINEDTDDDDTAQTLEGNSTTLEAVNNTDPNSLKVNKKLSEEIFYSENKAEESAIQEVNLIKNFQSEEVEKTLEENNNHGDKSSNLSEIKENGNICNEDSSVENFYSENKAEQSAAEEELQKKNEEELKEKTLEENKNHGDKSSNLSEIKENGNICNEDSSVENFYSENKAEQSAAEELQKKNEEELKEKTLEENKNHGDKSSNLSEIKENGNICNEDSCVENFYSENKAEQSATEEELQKKNEEELKENTQSKAVKNKTDPKDKSLKKSKKIVSNIVIGTSLAESSSSENKAQDKESKRKVECIKKSLGQKSSIESWNMEYEVDINDPIVINEDTAQDPIVINEDTAQDPIVINEDTAQDPIVINEDTAQDPVVINEDTAQDPIVINEDTAQDPIVINEDTAQDPIVINEDTAQDPIVINKDTAQNPIVINEDTAQDPIVINEDTDDDDTAQTLEGNSTTLEAVNNTDPNSLKVNKKLSEEIFYSENKAEESAIQEVNLIKNFQSEEVEKTLEENNNHGDKSSNLSEIKENGNICNEDSSVENFYSENKAEQSAAEEELQKKNEEELKENTQSKAVKNKTDPKDKSLKKSKKIVSNIVIGTSLAESSSSENKAQDKESKRKVECIKKSLGQKSSIESWNMEYEVDINDPIVINEDTAQDPIVINEDTAQDPIVINEDTAQDPIVINEDTAQDPIVINEDTAQNPIVINEDTAQDPIVINEDTDDDDTAQTLEGNSTTLEAVNNTDPNSLKVNKKLSEEIFYSENKAEESAIQEVNLIKNFQSEEVEKTLEENNNHGDKSSNLSEIKENGNICNEDSSVENFYSENKAEQSAAEEELQKKNEEELKENTQSKAVKNKTDPKDKSLKKSKKIVSNIVIGTSLAESSSSENKAQDKESKRKVECIKKSLGQKSSIEKKIEPKSKQTGEKFKNTNGDSVHRSENGVKKCTIKNTDPLVDPKKILPKITKQDNESPRIRMVQKPSNVEDINNSMKNTVEQFDVDMDMCSNAMKKLDAVGPNMTAQNTKAVIENLVNFETVMKKVDVIRQQANNLHTKLIDLETKKEKKKANCASKAKGVSAVQKQKEKEKPNCAEEAKDVPIQKEKAPRNTIALRNAVALRNAERARRLREEKEAVANREAASVFGGFLKLVPTDKKDEKTSKEKGPK